MASSRAARHKSLAAHVRAVRKDTYTFASRAQADSELSRSTYAAVEAGRNVHPDSWAKIEKLYRWPPQSCEAYLQGRAPLPGQNPAAAAAAAPSGLPADVAALLDARGAHTVAEQVAVLQSFVLNLVRTSAAGQ